MNTSRPSADNSRAMARLLLEHPAGASAQQDAGEADLSRALDGQAQRAREILINSTRGFLATRSRADRAVVHPMSVFFRADGLWMNTYVKSAKALNMVQNPAVAVVVVENGDGDPRPPGVLVRGRVEMLPIGSALPPAEVQPAYSLASTSDLGERGAARTASGKRRWFRLPILEATLLEARDA